LIVETDTDMVLWCLLLPVTLALVAAEPRGLEFLMGKMTNDHTASPRTNAVVPESSMLVRASDAPDLNTAHPLHGTGYDGGQASLPVEFSQARRNGAVPEIALGTVSCEMDPLLVGSFNYSDCSSAMTTSSAMGCPSSGFLQYTDDCHMYAEMKYDNLVIPVTIWYTGVVVPAQKPDSAVTAKCVEHVVTGSSVAASVAGQSPGSISDRCPSLSDDHNTLTIRLGFGGVEAENELIWTREVTSRDPAYMETKCQTEIPPTCDLSYAKALQSVEDRDEKKPDMLTDLGERIGTVVGHISNAVQKTVAKYFDDVDRVNR